MRAAVNDFANKKNFYGYRMMLANLSPKSALAYQPTDPDLERDPSNPRDHL